MLLAVPGHRARSSSGNATLPFQRLDPIRDAVLTGGIHEDSVAHNLVADVSRLVYTATRGTHH